ncbi:MAG: hypothetical protein WD294_10300 [Phycisphaeraceae bacterium]
MIATLLVIAMICVVGHVAPRPGALRFEAPERADRTVVRMNVVSVTNVSEHVVSRWRLMLKSEGETKRVDLEGPHEPGSTVWLPIENAERYDLVHAIPQYDHTVRW